MPLTADADVQAQAFELMKELVAITGEKWVSASRFSAIADRFGVSQTQDRIVFLTGIKALMRDIPVQVFPDMDARQAILNAAQDALDHAIEQEDEAQEE